MTSWRIKYAWATPSAILFFLILYRIFADQGGDLVRYLAILTIFASASASFVAAYYLIVKKNLDALGWSFAVLGASIPIFPYGWLL